ncbi:MAG: endonuclease III [candidate division Zixibacteria bacterium]
MNKKTIAKRAARIDSILAKMYGVKKQTRFRDPTEELILTVLSQNTNDINRDRAYESLRDKFPGWSEVASAGPDRVESAIKVGGLANIKSKRIIKILKQINSKSSGYSLDFLKDMSDGEVWDYLSNFDGVGPKTASCVMMFALGRDTMPVDTHVHRIGIRLGLIPEEYSAEEAHVWFGELLLPVDIYQMHLNMISHGRALCRPSNPKCEQCPLKRNCLYYRKQGE